MKKADISSRYDRLKMNKLQSLIKELSLIHPAFSDPVLYSLMLSALGEAFDSGYCFGEMDQDELDKFVSEPFLPI